jgi:hypothetical protein
MNYEKLRTLPSVIDGVSFIYTRRKGVDYRLYKPNQQFMLPTPKGKYVVAAFKDDVFLNAMFAGTYSDASYRLLESPLSELKVSYAEYLNNLSVADIRKLQQHINKQKMEEVRDIEDRFARLLRDVDSRYGKKMVFLDRVLEKRLLDADVGSDVYYVYQLQGFMPSIAYGTYASAKRAHSKRNLPNIPCTIHRCIGDKETFDLFAAWDLGRRTWLINA